MEGAHGSAKKPGRPRRRSFKSLIIALVVGLVIGVGAVLGIQSALHSGQESNVSIVFDRVMKQDQLVTASQKYTVVEKASDVGNLFGIDLPFTENSYWYRFVGTIQVAVDLSSAELVSQDEGSVTIRLHQPFISSNTPDMDESGVLEERNNLLNPIHLDDVDDLRRECITKVEEEAAKGDLFDEARTNAEADLSQLFSVSLGEDYQVTIEWVDE